MQMEILIQIVASVVSIALYILHAIVPHRRQRDEK
ncbi:immunity protein, partial [Burkholderia pseudomallei]